MPLETPVQIDLSNDNSWDQVDDSLLTPEDKQLLREHFTEESEGIIYLTHQELQELKQTIDATRDPRGESGSTQILGESFHSFIEEQKTEGISTEDFLSHVEGLPEGVSEAGTQMDAIAHEKLFGNEGIMKDIKLSATAQDNISMSLSLTVLQEIAKIEDFSGDKIEEQFDAFVEKLGIIEASFTNTEITESGESLYKPTIRGEGEANYIFMDVVEGNKFFSQIFSGDITSANLKGYIEDRNLPEGSDTQITHRITGIQELVASEDIQDLFQRLTGQEAPNNTGDGDNEGGGEDSGIPDGIPTGPEERKSYIEKLKEGNLIEQMFAALLEVLENIGIYEDSEVEDDTSSQTGPENETISEQVAKTPSQQIRTFFSENADSGIFVGVNKESIAELFPTEGELPQEAKNILARIEAIPGEESIEDKLNNLFSSKVAKVDGDTSQGEVTKIERFLLDMKEATDTTIDIKNADGSLNSSALLRAVHAYSSYRIRNEAWKAESGNEDKEMPYSDFFKENIGSSEE